MQLKWQELTAMNTRGEKKALAYFFLNIKTILCILYLSDYNQPDGVKPPPPGFFPEYRIFN